MLDINKINFDMQVLIHTKKDRVKQYHLSNQI